MSNIYIKITSRDSLERSWSYLFKKTKKTSRNTTGIDGQSINDFRADEKGFLNSLSRDIANGEYNSSALKPFLIPKKGNKYRLICVPTVRDRIVQRAVLDFLTDKYRNLIDNNISYGFVPERTVQEAALKSIKLRVGNNWVFKTDISSFFDQIPRDLLKERISKVIKHQSIHKFLFSVIDSEVDAKSKVDREKIRALGIKAGLGLRQGMPLSPFFANIILGDFDSELIKEKMNVVRYADDLIFFAKSKNECLKIAELCKAKLAKLQLNIPEIYDGSKSSIHSPTEPVEFLGLTITYNDKGTYELALSKEQRERIRDEFLKLASIPELVSRRVDFSKIGNHLISKRDGYLAAYECCTNITMLEIELENIVQKVLKKIYKDGLGIDLQSLDPITKNFLLLK